MRLSIVKGEGLKKAVARLEGRAGTAQEDARQRVLEILAEVREKGDAALLAYTERFDGAKLQSLRVSEAEIAEAYAIVGEKAAAILKRSAKNIRAFHEQQKQASFMNFGDEIKLGQIVRPLASAGIYVPGGRAAYPSSVLMNAIPASVAGVERIVMVTPPGKDGKVTPMTLVAASVAGVKEIYKVGGAQAVAALAYGTESVPAVDKIVGPGNLYVALAKREVFGQVGIDMIAGPSEILVVADGSANPEYVAADLLSQAEHDPLAAAILLTDDAGLAERVLAEVERQTAAAPRREIIERSLEDFGILGVVDSLTAAVDQANAIAPEHLELAVADPFALLGRVKNAGSIFLGHYAPEPLGDYFAGPNHVLPTNGTARFSSPLGVYDFVKRSSVIHYTKEALQKAGQDIVDFAGLEGLFAHGQAVSVRMKEETK